MPTPLPTQLSGALFLASHNAALLADEPRVGKTGAAIIAADYILAHRILVVTTKSGCSVWKRGLAEWSKFGRVSQVLTPSASRLKDGVTCAIVAWGSITDNKIRAELLKHKWDLVIGDEDHLAKSFEAKRTQAFYGILSDDGTTLYRKNSLASMAPVCWPLTGTPLPNSPFDMYPRLRALAPERLAARNGWPDVTAEKAFKERYCVTRPMKIGHGSYARRLDVIVSGKNEAELGARIGDFMLLRTQKDVGIRPPVYETYPLPITDRQRSKIDAVGGEHAEILAAAETGDTRKLEMHTGPMRRLTGEIKAELIVEAMKDEFECGLDKVVLMRWHDNVGQIIRHGLSKYGVVSIDGSTSSADRLRAEEQFRDDPNCRVFDGQIQAAGEAIDLSAAALLIFVEQSFIPKDMKQASLRITNHTQTRQAFVRVAVLEGSIDEALQTVLLRKWGSIREVLPNARNDHD